MKIYQLTTFFHPVTGGVESHVYDLSKLLIEKGHQVEILCSDSTKTGPRLKERNSLIAGIPVHRFRSWFSLSYYHKFCPGLIPYLLMHDFDVIHVHGFRKPDTYIALAIAALKKKKVVLTSHNPFPTTSRSKIQELFIKLHDLTFGKLFTRKLSKIIVLLDSEKAIFTKKFNVPKDKLVTIPNALDAKFYQPGDKEQFYKDWNINPAKWKAIVVSAGRLEQAKGFQNLHKAVKELPKILFFIAGGDDGYLEKLKVLYADCPNIIFSEHFVASKKLIDMYAAADLFVFPSLHEAFGLVLLESLAQGTPVISTNIGGPADFITEDIGILVDPRNQAIWKESITDLLKNKEKLEKMSANAVLFSQKYSWDKQIAKIIKAYK